MNIYQLLSLLETKFRAGKMSSGMRRIVGKMLARVDYQCGGFALSMLPRIEKWLISL